MFDGFEVGLIEVDPEFDTVAEGLWVLGGDEPEAVDLFAPVEVFPNELEGEVFVDFLLVGLGLGDLEDEPASLLVLLILPFGLDPLPEELDRVDLLAAPLDLVATYQHTYLFCL